MGFGANGANYSGMLPGTVAGRKQNQRALLDFRAGEAPEPASNGWQPLPPGGLVFRSKGAKGAKGANFFIRRELASWRRPAALRGTPWA